MADVVYLEDVETKLTKLTKIPAEHNGSKTAIVSNKRQRSIADMFGDEPRSSSTAEPVAKKIKASASDSTQSRIGSAGTQDLKLNAIPFSLSQYQETFSDEERKLLALECACMGKSWCSLNLQYRFFGVH